MNEILAFVGDWWGPAALVVLLVVGAWSARARQRYIESTTVVCPMCHGLGRLDREPRS